MMFCVACRVFIGFHASLADLLNRSDPVHGAMRWLCFNFFYCQQYAALNVFSFFCQRRFCIGFAFH